MDTTERGQFRSIEMDDLTTWENHPMWNNELSKNSYIFPVNIPASSAKAQGQALSDGIPAEEIYTVGHYICAKSPQTHRAAFKHAVDFLVLDGTPIIATRAGTVFEIQEHSNSWGDDISFRDTLNYITLQHDNGEFTQYCHLAQYSCRDSNIRVGHKVRTGQCIGTVGKTGLTDRDHLHFIVFRGHRNESPFQFKSLRPQWSAFRKP